MRLCARSRKQMAAKVPEPVRPVISPDTGVVGEEDETGETDATANGGAGAGGGGSGSDINTRFLSILPFGLKPQFDTTHWVPHGSIHHPAVASTARLGGTLNGSGAGGVGGVGSTHGSGSHNGMSFIDDKSKIAAAAAGPAKPKGAITIIKDFEINSLTAELTTTVWVSVSVYVLDPSILTDWSRAFRVL